VERVDAEAPERCPPGVAPGPDDTPAPPAGFGTGEGGGAPPGVVVVEEGGCVGVVKEAGSGPPAAGFGCAAGVGTVAGFGFAPGLVEAGELEGGAGGGDQAICWAATGRECTNRQAKTARPWRE
jgi:hypothetical protein